jgi:hypothetical protein
MGIDAKLENRAGQCWAELADPKGYVTWLISLPSVGSSACMRFIDPYGITLFNSLQLPVLRSELEELRPLVTDENIQAAKRQYLKRTATWPSTAQKDALTLADAVASDQLRLHLTQLTALLSRGIEAGPHQYCRFVGD